jgi:plastocyanin
MRLEFVVSLLSIVAGAACAQEASPSPSSPVAASVPAPVAAAASAPAPAATSAPPTSGNGTPKKTALIVGTVATEPYHFLKNGAVVYLEDGPKEPGAGVAAAIDNHDMTFVPFISVITAGGTVTFGNTDPMVHNAFSPDGEKWDIGEIPTHGAVAKTFTQPNVYSVLCNLHKNMLAYLVVSPSSYFTKVDADGKYSLSVPPGTYHVTAWSPRLKPTTLPVTVSDGEVTLDFKLGR